MPKQKRPKKPTGEKKPPAKMGRPRKEFDWAAIARMAHIQCTGPEIAAVLECCLDTLCDHCKRDFGVTFSEWRAQKAEGGKCSLRRVQWQNALKGNATMQIWLGKQVLGQRDYRDPPQLARPDGIDLDLSDGAEYDGQSLEARSGAAASDVDE